MAFKKGPQNSRNLSKIVSVLLSASVERFFVSRVRDFYLARTKYFMALLCAETSLKKNYSINSLMTFVLNLAL